MHMHITTRTLHMCVHTGTQHTRQMHKYAHTIHVHTGISTHAHIPHMQAHARTHVHPYTTQRTCAHAHTRHACTHMFTHYTTYVCTHKPHMHARVHTCSHTHYTTHVCTHSQPHMHAEAPAWPHTQLSVWSGWPYGPTFPTKMPLWGSGAGSSLRTERGDGTSKTLIGRLLYNGNHTESPKIIVILEKDYTS